MLAYLLGFFAYQFIYRIARLCLKPYQLYNSRVFNITISSSFMLYLDYVLIIAHQKQKSNTFYILFLIKIKEK